MEGARALEIWTALGEWSPPIAVAVLCLYFYNQFVIRTLDERKEWNEKLEKLLERYDVRLQAAVETGAKVAAENHALRGIIQQFMNSVEAKFMALDNRIRGGGND